MKCSGVIIEESLTNKDFLKKVKITSTQVEKVTKAHKTPWLKQWTLHNVEIPQTDAPVVAGKLSHALEPNYWYADFKNAATHYIVFPNKVFTIDCSQPEQYKQVVAYGQELGIPDYQLDFTPVIEQWERPEN